MMNHPKTTIVALCAVLAFAGLAGNARALNQETELLLKLLEKKGVITSDEAKKFRAEIAATSLPTVSTSPPRPQENTPPTATDEPHHLHSVQSIGDRLDKLEKDIQPGGIGVISDKVKIGGVVEIEASAENVKDGVTGVNTATNDLVLAKAALELDLRANKYVAGRAVLQYEEGEEDDHLFLDEGIVALSGGDDCPYSVKGGKMYVPFGHFESHFVTDPITLSLGETQDTSLLAGYEGVIVNVAMGGFRGAVKETGENDHLNVYLASLGFKLPENSIPDLKLSVGTAFISNIAESKSLRNTTSGEGLTTNTIDHYVSGLSSFLSLAFLDKYFLDAEYLSATHHFSPGELAFDNGADLQPEAWNIEMAYAFTEHLETALRYEGSHDYGDIQPEHQYGGALLYKFFPNTSLTLEYLYGRYASKAERHHAATQLLVSF